MKKALEILKEIKNQKPFVYILTSVLCRALVVNENSKLDEAIAEIEEAQETIKNLQHNYDVQVEYSNTAYKNYTNMVNSLEQRIKELEEAMKPKTCEWYKEDEEDWRGQCGCIWGFNGENPTMAEAYFCPQCGGKILVPHKKKEGL